jgi:hypothetical protein
MEDARFHQSLRAVRWIEEGDADLPRIPLQANDRPTRIYPWGGGEADPERMNFDENRHRAH